MVNKLELKRKQAEVTGMKIQVNSEIGKLRAVIMQPPGKGIERCTPLNIGALAWDAVPSPHKAEDEHKKWVATVEKFGARVFLMEDLFKILLFRKCKSFSQLVQTEESFITSRLWT